MTLPHRLPVFAAVVGLLVAALAACNPVFNWREVPVGDAGLVALLPCKPDRATRAMPLGVEAVTVDMAGCEAGGATFAVAHAVASSQSQAEGWLRAWRSATRSQLGDAAASAVEAPATVPRAAGMPAPLRLDAAAAAADAPALQVLWFAQRRADGVSLYQATVVGRPATADAPQIFFEGLHIP
ncbi:hypothetical protein QTH87_00100 [Variovorax sp. J22P168]|uniref:hypothetical protein n=1 Tax=Variovorax jilinensis TaxID=3053513 RepID=UPI002576105C|nr:hypothetical protein [Variovorax sp. J22P168]MDM0010825.1 hypothetical protein [Variovorax sp. J22P168]